MISGPSGVGKTTLVHDLVRHPGVVEAISATTRPRRPGERDGRDYLFWTPRRFERALRRGELAEWAEIYGRRYGTPKAPLLAAIRRGKLVIRNVDIHGWRALKRLPVPKLGVFVLPPSLAELRRRITARVGDDPASLAARMRAARHEMRHRFEYDVRVVNDDAARCARRILDHLRRRGLWWSPR